ncbi:AAA family ATPase [Chitinimonas sp. BJB300]|uniref:AAA family ATPase n=1 Tax=Chitinimonas sp. BJB300 TaxID=1559339 RepID=UPI000C104831|nr:AAA family ATPase [Chitinimonas sp. BJB300]PHV12830.1 AAA family ATPase [Chitinimonas sp. BJB300]TSJ88044.1 AAA family ATPase [Chitinimonas sp. BJB300]
MNAPPPNSPSLAPVHAVLDQLDAFILGKKRETRLALACLLGRGHLLIEDVPGVGKTTLAHALAATLGLAFQRVQFTSDMLPADLIGVSIYDRDNHVFRFHAGPIFSQVVLADEINRATPKTQSALLEAMEERQVTLDGETRILPDPFFVIATQNPASQIGTFPLPESQLDRFLMRITLGYPDAAAERAMLLGEDRRDMLKDARAVITHAELAEFQSAVRRVHVAPALVDYVQALARATRDSTEFHNGLSPRAALGLLAAARAWALLAGREMVIPEDVQAVFGPVATHRLLARASNRPQPELVIRLLGEVAIP